MSENGNGDQIYKLIPQVMKSVGSVSKDRKNEQQKYMFRGIEDLYEAVHPALIAHGVFCAPNIVERDCYRFEKTNSDGKATIWVHVAIKVEHVFYAPDASSITVTTWGEGLDNSDKATNKAMSAAMKYALIELFCIPTKDTEDADRSTPENGVARLISEDQVRDLTAMLDEVGADRGKFLDYMGAPSLDRILARDHVKAVNALESKRRARK